MTTFSRTDDITLCSFSVVNIHPGFLRSLTGNDLMLEHQSHLESLIEGILSMTIMLQNSFGSHNNGFKIRKDERY